MEMGFPIFDQKLVSSFTVAHQGHSPKSGARQDQPLPPGFPTLYKFLRGHKGRSGNKTRTAGHVTDLCFACEMITHLENLIEPRRKLLEPLRAPSK